MSENLKTIKELADELGVSKQTIRNKIVKDFREKFVQTIKIKGNNTLVINNAGYSLLKKTLQNDTAQTAKTLQNDTAQTAKTLQNDTAQTAKTLQNDTAQTKLICFLEEQLDKKEQQLSVKDKQLENKDTQISQMQNLLDQQQRLALQDKKLLEEYKSEINELKALKMPREDMKDGSSIRGEAQEEIERLKAKLKLSEEERNKAKEKEPVKTESKKWWHFGRM
ncbi:DNA-binding protein [Lactococcus cremoris]|uniref:DNA-binding protein n=1 Tax=Lactococcus lactis subsp. cremoris TaxID=1359 RepID=UPI0037BF6F54